MAFGVIRYLEFVKRKDEAVARASRSTSSPASVRETTDVILEDKPESQPPPPRKDRPTPELETERPGEGLPGPKPESRPTPEERELEPILERLKSGSPENRVEAADELARMGKKGQPAARALCEAATDSSEKVSRAALVALEKVHPDLQQPVLVLLIDGAAANHIKALSRLDQLGDEASPAVPVVVHQIKKCKALLEEQLTRGRGVGWDSQTLFEVIDRNMRTLTKVGSKEPETVKALTDLAKVRTDQPIFLHSRKINTFVPSNYPFRSTAVEMLGVLADKRPDYRKEIVPTLLTVLSDGCELTKSTNPIEVLVGVSAIESAGDGLLKCGPAAKTAMGEEVLPRVKELQFHESAQVRQAADKLRKKIEDGK
jgi:hypothetical protein